MEFGTANKKPVLIDWFKWEGDLNDLFEWVETFGQKTSEHFQKIAFRGLQVKTLEGSSYNVPEGYIIIRGIEGEYYPCEPTIFEKTYNINILNKK